MIEVGISRPGRSSGHLFLENLNRVGGDTPALKSPHVSTVPVACEWRRGRRKHVVALRTHLLQMDSARRTPLMAPGALDMPRMAPLFSVETFSGRPCA